MKRFLALALFPAAAALLVIAIAVWSRSAHSIEAGERYAVEADALVLLTPSVLLYLLALPVIWRRVAPVPARTVAIFASVTFGLTVVGLVLLMGPIYKALSPDYPMLADRAFFFVFPFAPVLAAIVLSARVLRPRPGPSTVLSAPER